MSERARCSACDEPLGADAGRCRACGHRIVPPMWTPPESPPRKPYTRRELLRDALYDVTGRRLAVVTAVADSAPDAGEAEEAPLDERGFIALLESDLDATEVEEKS